MQLEKKIAVFLDRDGVINEEVNYLYKPEDLILISSAIEAINILNRNEILTIVVTNQAGVARGYFSEGDVETLHQYIQSILSSHESYVDAFYYCPHHPSEGLGDYLVSCDCRKPKPGMLHQAAVDFGIELNHSYIVGDKYSDIVAGQQAGCKTILVMTGHGANELKLKSIETKVDHIAMHILDAVLWIVKDIYLSKSNKN
jgi:D-glycero-D-manno-heptose 1,7-bisphosphate phosphatase